MNLFNVYPLWEIEPVKAEGARIWDAQGTEYFDMYGGHAVISIGHSHPSYVSKISDQLSKIAFYSNSVQNPLQVELAKKLGEISGYNDYSLFLCNSGAEANENALKLASFHTGRKKILSLNKSFHGRTSGAVEATDNPNIQSDFNKNNNAVFVPINDSEAAIKELKTQNYAAFIIEAIQGVAGIHCVSTDYIQEIAKVCKETKTLLIFDEVQCGYGRTGDFFAHQAHGVKGDIITTAKGMANGFPIGGVLISSEINAKFGLLGTTFGGNHLACAAAIAVLDIIKEENLVYNAREAGNYIISKLKDSKIKGIKDLRGRGLMIGIDLEEGYENVRHSLLFEKFIFTGAAGKSVIRLLPPLNITKKEVDIFIQSFIEVTDKI